MWRAALPDGDVVRLGGDSVEDVGPDLTGLFVGSEGLFGVALEITVRLIPRPETYRTVLASYAALQAAAHAGYPREAAAVLLVELEGEQAQADAELSRLRAVLDQSAPTHIRVARNADERALVEGP